jgi:hypothetical protein
MKVRSFPLLVVFTLGVVSIVPLRAQNTGGGVPSLKGEEGAAPVIDEVKLIAQRAAIASLGGEDPFVLRESSWSGVIDPGKARLIQLQLFKRNEYQFWMAVPDRKAGVNVSIYNGKGELIETGNVTHASGNVAGLIIRPRETGVYYLRISLQTTIKTPQKWSVIYAYR